MKVLVIADHVSHEIAMAAGLELYHGYNVYFIHIKPCSDRDHIEYSGGLRVVIDREKQVIVPFIRLCLRNPFTTYMFKKIAGEEAIDGVDVVVTNLRSTWFLGRVFSKKYSVPIAIRVWGVWTSRFREKIAYGREYYSIPSIPLSYLFTLRQLLGSSIVVSMDMGTYKHLARVYRVKSLFVYPSISEAMDTGDTSYAMEVIERFKEEYILCIASLSRPKGGVWNEEYLLKIVYGIAKKLRDYPVVVAGTSWNDLRGTSLYSLFKKVDNVYFLGWVPNSFMRVLYRYAVLVLAPIFYGSTVSNRIVEAIYHGKKLLTNTNASRLYPCLRNVDDIIVSDEYSRYYEIAYRAAREGVLFSREVDRLYWRVFSTKTHTRVFNRYIRDYLL